MPRSEEFTRQGETHFLFFLSSFFRLDVMTNPEVRRRAEPAMRVALSLRPAEAVSTLSCTS